MKVSQSIALMPKPKRRLRGSFLIGLLSGITFIASSASSLLFATETTFLSNNLASPAEQVVEDSTSTDGVAKAEFAPLEPIAEHGATTRNMLRALRERHYVSKDLDDQSSELILSEYLTDLDPSKSYLIAEDIDDFQRYRLTLDNAILSGDLQPAFMIFNRYQKRVLDRLDWVVGQLEAGLSGFDFTSNETLALDRSEAPWAISLAELDALWLKRIKNDVLNLKLTDKPLEDIEPLLLKRYKNRLNRASQTRSDDVFQLFVNALAKTYDPHTQYFSPTTAENFNINMSLSLEGIGAVLAIEDEYTKVVSLVPAGPADKSKGLKPNDRITSVGQGTEGEMVDVIGWRLDDVVKLIRGKKDTVVRLEVLPAAAMDNFSTKTIPIVRNKVELEEQSAQSEILSVERYGQAHRIGVIDIPTFYIDFEALQAGDANYRSTTRDVKRLLAELKAEQVDAIVIDLRDNGGGSLQEAKTLTGLFIDRGPTVQIRSKSDRVDVLTDRDYRTEYQGPLGVIVNRLSASASEIFAGAIQDYGRGLVIGTQTFGKGTVQTLQPLLRGQLKMTQAKFYRISGESTQHRGIVPDIQYPEDYDPETIGESTLDRPLIWDKITPAFYRPKADIQQLVPELLKLHSDRLRSDPEFQYIEAAFSYRKSRRDITEISLNESTRRAEQSEAKAFWLELTNKKRVAQGLGELASLEELDAEVEPGLSSTSSPNIEVNENSATNVMSEPLADPQTHGLAEGATFQGSSADMESATIDVAETEEETPDAYLVEAANILSDFIGLTQKSPKADQSLSAT
ncbi:MAG: carboxy terminal-processing peptidase [Pseudomonadales bacterium]